MSALLDKLRNGTKLRAAAGGSSRLAEGSLLSQALQRAHAERAAARNEPIAPPPPEVDEPTPAPSLPGDAAPGPRGRGLAALLLAIVILVITIAVWHAVPSPMPTEPPQSLKLDHNLKGK